MTEEKKTENLPAVKANVEMLANGGLRPVDFDGLYRMAKIMAASGLMPKGIQTTEAVFVAVQMGLEVGLSPMAAVQNIAVINGRPAIWGDAVLALVRASGLLEDFDETIMQSGDSMTATCKAVRKGQASPIVRTFSTVDAKAAGLHGKEGPWKQYTKRMLQMRARSWALRDGFSDVLRGFKQAEEVMDYDMEMVPNAEGGFEPPREDTTAADFAAAFGELPRVDEFAEHCAKVANEDVMSIKARALKDRDKFKAACVRWSAPKVGPSKPKTAKVKEDPAPPAPMTDEEKAAIVAGEAAEEGMP